MSKLETTDDEGGHLRQIKTDLQAAISEVQRWLKVKTDYANLRNRFEPDYHYQLECCLHDAKLCNDTLDFSRQVSLQNVQKAVDSLLKSMENKTPAQYKKLVCLKQKLENAKRIISEWHQKGMPLEFKQGNMTGLDTKIIVYFGDNEIQKGDKLTWIPNEKRDFKIKILAVDSADNIKYEAFYKAPFEFVNNICWKTPRGDFEVEMRPFFEVYLGELYLLFPSIQDSYCEK